MSSEKVGWGDDIVAPRQEVNTLSMLYEEASIQAALEQRELDPLSFLDAYRQARTAFREGSGAKLEPSPAQTIELTQRVALFGAQASARARHQSRGRAMLSCICPDRPGILASLSKLIAAEGGNIEGAVMSVVAGHLVTVFLVSGMSETPRREVEGLEIAYLPMEAEDVDWPRPGSTCWHVRASASLDSGLLLELTTRIREGELPLVTLSSWNGPDLLSGGEEIEFVDLNFALAPSAEGRELHTIRRLEAAVTGRLPGAQVDIEPVLWPTRYRSQVDLGTKRERDQVLTIAGHAQPGFVNEVVRTLMEDLDPVVDIRGSSMAILEGMSVLTIVLTRSERTPSDEIERQVKRKVPLNLRRLMGEAPVPQVQMVDAGNTWSGQTVAAETQRPSHELRLQVAEQPGVVMKVSDLLARHGVNITWFVSQVREPIIGERWPVCDIQMHLFIPEEVEYADVDAALRTLTVREGWDEAWLGEWSLGR